MNDSELQGNTPHSDICDEVQVVSLSNTSMATVGFFSTNWGN